MPDAAPAIEVEGLEKSYGAVRAVQGISFSVGRGEVFALLGPNGAGKTTTVEILEGFRPRDGGRVSVLGVDPATAGPKLKERIGIVLQSTGLERYMTVRETVDQYRSYFPSPRPAAEVMEVVGLASKSDERVSRLSGGQQRRLDVAIGLAGDPELLFLDEPTTGFDPSARRSAWDMVGNLASLGKTVLLTTHYMDEAQALAGRVAIMAAGRILAEGRPSDIGGRATAGTRISFAGPPADLPSGLRERARLQDGRVMIESQRPTADLLELTSWAVGQGMELQGLTVSRPSLEDAYLDITRGEAGQ